MKKEIVEQNENYDDKKFGWFHVKMIIIAGSGFFTDAYDLLTIGMLTNLLGRLYYQDNPFIVGDVVSPGRLPIQLNCAVSAVALCGTLAGQIIFGRLGDMFGRKATFNFCLLCMTFCAFAQSMSFGTRSNAVIGTLCMWRFLLGIGIGGGYPLSATIMSEFSSVKSRGAYVGAIFAFQGFGILVSAGVVCCIAAIFKKAFVNAPYPVHIGNCASYVSTTPFSPVPKWSTCLLEDQQAYWLQIKDSCPPSADYIWRICLAIGAVPSTVVFYWGTKMDETPRFRVQAIEEKAEEEQKDLETKPADTESVQPSAVFKKFEGAKTFAARIEKPVQGRMPAGEFFRKHGRELLGCAMTWGLLDVAFYSQNLFQKDVYTQIGWLPPAKYMNAAEETERTARCQALIALGSTIPGYWMTVATVDYLGRKNIQFLGFICMTAFMAAMAGAYDHLLNPNNSSNTGPNSIQPAAKNGFIAMYAFCFFFANWGPNATTFVVPAELFPTEWKTTGHGISAAAGKAGAILGAFGFMYASQPAKGMITWSFPCSDASMMNSAHPTACAQSNNCPTGRTAPTKTLGSTCSICKPHVMSGCYPFGIGVPGALGILAATNFLGLLFTFLIPETKGKTLEELNGTAPGKKADQFQKQNKDGIIEVQ